jgi:UDP-N-acetylglucosamine pyrophosphorylase
VLYNGQSLAKVVLEGGFGFTLKFCERSILQVSQNHHGKEHAG